MSKHTTLSSAPPLVLASRKQQEPSSSTPTDAAMQPETTEIPVPAPGERCKACQSCIEHEYFHVDGFPICARCAAEYPRALDDRGSGVSRLARACAGGAVAATLGALLYFAIGRMTGYEFSLIAIVVGVAVGAAVRWGCYGRGGPLYQGIAMALTYLAIVGSYVPAIIAEVRAGHATHEQIAGPGEEPSTPAAPAADLAEPPSLADLIVAMMVVLAIAAAAPFLGGFQNFVGLVIIAIGVYEAWKINKRRVLAITGPYALTTQAPAPASVS